MDKSKGWVHYAIPTGGTCPKEFSIEFGKHLASLGRQFVIGDFKNVKSEHKTVDVFVKIS